MTQYLLATRCSRCGSDERVVSLQIVSQDADGTQLHQLLMGVCIECRRDLLDWAARRPDDEARVVPVIDLTQETEREDEASG